MPDDNNYAIRHCRFGIFDVNLEIENLNRKSIRQLADRMPNRVTPPAQGAALSVMRHAKSNIAADNQLNRKRQKNILNNDDY